MKISILIIIIFLPTLSIAKDIYIVLNKGIKEEVIGKKYIQSLFLKKKMYWDSGKKIRPIDQALGTKAREQFLNQILMKSEIEMAEYWIEQKQVNGLVQPIQLDNNNMVLQLVGSLQGSIGYILVDSLNEIDTSNFKVLELKK